MGSVRDSRHGLELGTFLPFPKDPTDKNLPKHTFLIVFKVFVASIKAVVTNT